MKSVLGQLTCDSFLRALSGRYCKHPTLSAVESKEAGRKAVYSLCLRKQLEGRGWRVLQVQICLCSDRVDCISENLHFVFYILVSVYR